MPKGLFSDPDDSQYGLQLQKSSKVLRRLFNTAEIVRCQVTNIVDDVTVQVLTPRQTYRYVRKSPDLTVVPGTYVSVLNPGGEKSGKIWEIIGISSVLTYSAGVVTLNGLSGLLSLTGSGGVTISPSSPNIDINVQQKGVFGVSLDGNGDEITTGLKGYVRLPVAGTITKWTILGDLAGSIEFDIWKDTYANFPPDSGDSIVSGSPPIITNDNKNEDSALTGWDKSILAGDVFGFNIESCDLFTKVTLEIEYNKL